MTVSTGWLSRLLATWMLGLLTAASTAWAQEAPSTPVDPDKVLEAARKDLAQLQRQQDKGLDDEADLQELRKQALSVQSRAEEASAALEKLCIDAIRVGLEERRVRLAEQDAELWVRMIDGVLTDLGHDPNAPETAEVVERHLRAVA